MAKKTHVYRTSGEKAEPKTKREPPKRAKAQPLQNDFLGNEVVIDEEIKKETLVVRADAGVLQARVMQAVPLSAAVNESVSLEDAKERALLEMSNYATETWEQYGVPASALAEEMTASVSAPRGSVERGLGTTINISLEKKRQAIKDATGIAVLTTALAKAKVSIHTAAVYLWARGKAVGPATQDNFAKLARKADNLADHLDKLGNEEAAKRQRERAEKLRAGEVPPKREKKPERLPKPCLCGCEKLTKGSFAPGHDSKVHSLVLRVARGKEQATVSAGVIEYVKKSGWLTNVELESLLESQKEK